MPEFGYSPHTGQTAYGQGYGHGNQQGPIRRLPPVNSGTPTVQEQPGVVRITDQPYPVDEVGVVRLSDINEIVRPTGNTPLFPVPPVPLGPVRRAPKTWVIFSGGMNGGIGSPRRMMAKLAQYGVDPNQMILLSNAFPTFVPERPDLLKPSDEPPAGPLGRAAETSKELAGRAVQTVGTPLNFGRNLYNYSSTQFPQSALSQSTYQEVVSALQQQGFQPGDRIGFVTHSAGAMRCREAANRLAKDYGIEPAFFTSLGSPMIEVDRTPFNGQPGQHLPQSTRHVAITSPHDPVTGVLPRFVLGVRGQPQWGDGNDARFTLDGYTTPQGQQMPVSGFSHCNYDEHEPAMWFLSELIKHPDGTITIPPGLKRLDQ